MVTIGVNLDGLDKVAEGMRVAPDVLDAAEREAMQKSVLVLEAEVKSLTPRVTGRLFSSIGHSVEPGLGSIRGHVGTAVHYAPWVEDGRGPVVARAAKALRFRIGGRVIYRRAVGPAAGRHMFRAGLAGAMPTIKQFFRDAAKRVGEAAKGG